MFVWMSFERRRAEFDENNADFEKIITIIHDGGERPEELLQFYNFFMLL